MKTAAVSEAVVALLLLLLGGLDVCSPILSDILNRQKWRNRGQHYLDKNVSRLQFSRWNRTQHKCHTEYLPLAQSEHEGLVYPLGWTLGPYSELCLMSHTWLCPLLLFRVCVHICNVFSTSMLINILLLSFFILHSVSLVTVSYS